MSAVVGRVDRRQSPSSRREFVASALETLTGRAPGASIVLDGSNAATLGHRESRALGGRSWSAEGAAATELAAGTVAVVVSGFVDNADELATALGTSGEQLKGSVAELLLLAYLQRGRWFAEAVGGAFAIVVWDGRSGELLAIRDRLGVEPLYLWDSRSADRVMVASEPKAILRDPDFPRRFDRSAIVDLFNSTSRVPGTTVYSQLREVRPGEIVSVVDGVRRHSSYWSLPIGGDRQEPERSSHVVAALLTDAVERRFDPTNPSQGLLLSGGLDSSVLCAIAAGLSSSEAIETFSFQYRDAEKDFKPDPLHVTLDEPFVQQMHEHIGSRHRDFVVENSGYEEALKATVRARDLPGVGDLDVALLRLFEQVGDHKSEVFSGEGADDLFGGYPWFADEWTQPSTTFPWLRGTQASDFLREEVREIVPIDEILRERRAAGLAEIPARLGAGDAEDHMTGVFYLELTRFLPFLLDRVDRMSAAAGVRVHLPFLDHRLVEYVWNVAYATKSVTGIEKGLLRRAFADVLPDAVATRKKSGFAVGKSPEYLNTIRQALHDILDDSNSVVNDIVDPAFLRSFLASAQWSDGRFSGPPILPRLVMLHWWSKLYDVTFEG